MELEIFILNEISQTGKDKTCMYPSNVDSRPNKKEWHECKIGEVWIRVRGRGEGKRRRWGDESDQILHTHVWKQNNETHGNCLKAEGGIRKSDRGGGFDTSTLYAYIKSLCIININFYNFFCKNAQTCFILYWTMRCLGYLGFLQNTKVGSLC
jgi:hypothetical protein